ncbi:MAG: DUF4149 domain-containing protein [Aquabacterium sp.]|uniref:DUF4149 domain-containing protein n=1 Tax=Aquabacterium sp. TaxID=1872578 RepID=UPI0011F7B5A0|nr:DUF4149 domain-containing protein [Aquabacterium sp.]TAK96700.1 MAG: DUF4149 domain-containing protein [Aquabacterium sp.]
MKLLRFQSWLAATWTGVMLAVGGLAAPSLFMVLERELAGKAAGRIFTLEAKLSLAFAMVLFVIERRRVRDLAESGQTTTVMTGNLLIILGALFLAIFGEFVMHPMMEAAKAGQPTNLSFGALHGLSSALYWLRAVLVGCLAWRLTANRAA